MNSYIIDFANAADKVSAHAIIGSSLNLPLYYGKNLDALYDCLTELEPSVIILKNTRLFAQTDFGEGIMQVFKEVGEENGDRIGIIIEDEIVHE